MSADTKMIRSHRGRWLVASLVSIAATAISFRYIDVRLAFWMLPFSDEIRSLKLQNVLGGRDMVNALVAVMIVLTAVRLLRGKWSGLAGLLILASLGAVIAYGINAFLLKMVFGVPTPLAVFFKSQHSFNWFKGVRWDCFPSDHMAMGSAFAGIVASRHPETLKPLVALLVAGGLLLLASEFHFLSDLIAGAWVGAVIAAFILRLPGLFVRREKDEGEAATDA